MGRIVVIEDIQDNFDLIADALGDRHELHHATQGPEGLVLVRQTHPDLILLDMQLPGLGGWDVVRCLKSDEDLAEIPVFAVTAHAMKGDSDRCMAAGCDAYISKPLDVLEFARLVDDTLNRRACEVGKL